MPLVTSIQRREKRSNQWRSYADYDKSYEVDHLEVSLDGPNGIRLFFESKGDKGLGVGLRIPREVAVTVAKIVEAVESGSGKIKIDLK
jgi:hypothetical protein